MIKSLISDSEYNYCNNKYICFFKIKNIQKNDCGENKKFQISD